MYEETGDDGRRRYTVNQIAAEFRVTRPTVYRHLAAKQTTDPLTEDPVQLLLRPGSRWSPPGSMRGQAIFGRLA